MMNKVVHLESVRSVSSSADDLRALANFMHGYASSQEGSFALERAGLLGVIKRHTVSKQESFAKLGALAADPYKGRFEAFAIRTAINGRFVGFASMQQDIELRRSNLPIPGKIMPRSDLIDKRANVAAWVDPDRIDERDALSDTYKKIGHRGALWALEPVGDISTFRVLALHDAHFHQIAEARFDDQEYVWHIPPQRTLFLN